MRSTPDGLRWGRVVWEKVQQVKRLRNGKAHVHRDVQTRPQGCIAMCAEMSGQVRRDVWPCVPRYLARCAEMSGQVRRDIQ